MDGCFLPPNIHVFDKLLMNETFIGTVLLQSFGSYCHKSLAIFQIVKRVIDHGKFVEMISFLYKNFMLNYC